MVLHGQADTTILAQYVYTHRIEQVHRRARVIMQIQDIAARTEITATGRIHQTGRIICFCPLGSLLGIELAPSLVEGHPYYYARIRDAQVHDLLPLLVIITDRLLGTLLVGSTVIRMRRPLVTHVAARHILPNQHTFLIAMIVPAGRLYLHVLADHVEAPRFRLHDIIQQRLVRGSRVKPVGPPALIQRAVLEQVLVVQAHTHDAVGVTLGGYLTEGGVRFHLVHLLAILRQAHLHII